MSTVTIDKAKLYDVAVDLLRELPPECEKRVTKALAIAENGEIWRDGPGYVCHSQTAQDQWYFVSDAYGCDCQDARSKAPFVNGRPHCKHYIASLLLARASSKRPSSPIVVPAGVIDATVVVPYKRTIRRGLD